MLHRFSSPDDGISGHDPATVRGILAYLRKQSYDLISLQEMFRRLRDGELLRRAIAFTIDDGYFDHGLIGGPIFAEFDCPVTIFAVTGFLDGTDWLWWDRTQFICEQTSKTQLTVRVGTEQRLFQLDSKPARLTAARAINLWCQDASQVDRVAMVGPDAVYLRGDLEAAVDCTRWRGAKAIQVGLKRGPADRGSRN